MKSKFLFSQEIPPENKTLEEEENQTSEDETKDKSLDEKKEIVSYFLLVFKLIQFKKISNKNFSARKVNFLVFFLAKKYLLKLKLQKKKKGKMNFVKTKRKKRKLWKIVNFFKLRKMKRCKNYFLVIS